MKNLAKIYPSHTGRRAQLRIVTGDNLRILPTVASRTARLIYIDPPFNTGKKQERISISVTKDSNGDRVGFGGRRYKTVNGDKNGYVDSFGDDFLAFLEPRLREAHRILAVDGSLFFHIDYREVHRCKLLLDKIFGRNSFINEIIWAYDYGGRAKNRWPPKHDNILWYAKDPSNYVFNYDQMDRIPYMAPSLVGSEKAARGKTPTDVWWHTVVPTTSREKTGYPSQKPVGLLERIVKIHSRPGDMLMDFFAGSGSFGEAAIKNNRDCLLVDQNPQARKIMTKRLAKYSPKIEKFVAENETNKSGNSAFIDPEAERIAKHVNLLADKYKQNSIWQNSPFYCLKSPRSSGQVGKIGKEAVKKWLQRQNFFVEQIKSEKIEADISVNSKNFQIRFSMLWQNGIYKFQQIRDQHYDFLICLGVSPFDAHSWVFTKEFLMNNWGKVTGFDSQHGGKAGSDTAWISFNPKKPPDWLRDKGGSLSSAIDVLRKFLPPD